MYFSASSRAVPVSARRCPSTSSTSGCRLFSPLNLGGNAVQITESMFLASAHSFSSGIRSGDRWPLDQLPMYSGFVRPSLRRSCSFASSRLSLSIRAHSDRTGRASHEITNVIRSSMDCRANSSGISGPSSNQYRWIGKVRGFQIREPQPRHAILVIPRSWMDPGTRPGDAQTRDGQSRLDLSEDKGSCLRQAFPSSCSAL